MPSATDPVVVGVDLGTLSARAVLVRVADGEELGTVVSWYPHGVMDTVLAASGAALPPEWALQVPADYLASLGASVSEAVRLAGVRPEQVVGIGTDFTACTVLPVLADGTPLCQLPEYVDRPHAYVKLWKHHAVQSHADRLNAIAHERGEPWIGRYGGKLSSEWELAKGLQLLEEDPELYARMDHWIEAADWIVWQLCGAYVRNVCTAGFKAARQDGAYPSVEYFTAVNSDFGRFVIDKLDRTVAPLGAAAGRLTAEAAALTGLPEGIAVSVGNVDAHVTVPVARAVEAGQMVAIMGTSTCHVMIAEEVRDLPGMCGVVEGGIVPGLWGFEAGQSGVGDIFGWFVDQAVPASVQDDAARAGRSVHEHLSELAAGQPVGAHGLVALDWHSGNRSVLVDHDLSGVIVGLTLQTRPEDVYRALVEATAFGTRVIVEAFEAAGLPVRDFVVAGGLLRNEFVMQTYADVLRRPLHVIGSEQGPALGSALHAAVAAGAHADIVAASAAMGRVERDVWKPDRARADAYDGLFDVYRQLHDHFGGGDLLHRLRDIRKEARRVTAPTELRREVCDLHLELVRAGLVVWTAGNVSARVPGADLLVIKPSGVAYDELRPEHLVVCDLEGAVVEGDLAPSSDTVSHAYIYRHLPEVGGVVHTHSTYAVAWAARGESVPCVLTAMADEFGGEIPVAPFALIGTDAIGQAVVGALRAGRSPAVLVQNHGPFTVGPDARSAVKTAVMCEDVCRTVHIARQLGEPKVIDPADIDRLYDRYQNAYGQPEAMTQASPYDDLELWFLTGSQSLYGPETLVQVAAQAEEVARRLDDASVVPVRVAFQPVLTTVEAIRSACLDARHDDRCIGVIVWMHTFSPAKMWIGGLQALGKPLLHLHTQANESLPWSTIDMDFMNLNQAAHGDREFGFVQTRMGLERKTVFGHVGDPAVQASVGRWARAAAGHHALGNLSLARFGDNMRNVAVTEGDKVAAEMRFGVSVNTWGVNDLVDAVGQVAERRVDDLVGQYLDEYDVAAELRPGGERHESLRVAAAIEGGLRAFLEDGGFGAFTTNFEDLGGLRQLPGLAVQRLMADGYGFGGEGDWKTAALLRTLKVMGAGRPGGTSFMEDYTYHLGPGVPKTLGAHMLEVCPTIAAGRPSCEVHPLAIGNREDPVRLVFDAEPGPALVVGLADLGSRFRLVGAEIDTVAPDEPLPALPVARAVWTSRPDLPVAATAWLTAGGPHHTVYSSAVDRETLDDFATMVGVELAVIHAGTTVSGFRDELRWNAAWYHLAQGL